MNAARSRAHTRLQLFKSLLLFLPAILSLSLLSPVYVYIKYACIFFRVAVVVFATLFFCFFSSFWMNGLLVQIFFPAEYVTQFLYVSHVTVCVYCQWVFSILISIFCIAESKLNQNGIRCHHHYHDINQHYRTELNRIAWHACVKFKSCRCHRYAVCSHSLSFSLRVGDEKKHREPFHAIYQCRGFI